MGFQNIIKLFKLDEQNSNYKRLKLKPLRYSILKTQVNWDKEKECFQTLAVETSSFYSLQYDPFLLDSQEQEEQQSTSETVSSQSMELSEVRVIHLELIIIIILIFILFLSSEWRRM